MKKSFLAAGAALVFGLLAFQILNAKPGRSMTAEDVIKKMKLEPMVAGDCGGYFREIFRSEREAKQDTPRKCCSIIYHLIIKDYKVPFHKITSDEIFTYLAGDPQLMALIHPDGRWEEVTLGNNLSKGETPVRIVPAGVWMAEAIRNPKADSWSLLTVTVAPGFDLNDYSHSTPADIIKNFPKAEKRIKELGLDKD